MANNKSKTFKLNLTKIGNGIIYAKETKQAFNQDLNPTLNDCKGFVEDALLTMKENETYAVTITVTKIK